MNDRRRLVIAWGAAIFSLSFAARAQQRKAARIGVLTLDPATKTFRREFVQGLADLGYAEGRNVLLEWRSTRDPDRLPGFALELVKLKVDVIVATPTGPVRAARGATTSTPIVMVAADPLGMGLVASLARPGGNITGISTFAFEVGGKLLELIREFRPRLGRVAVLLDTTAGAAQFLRQVESAAKTFGVQIQPLTVRRDEELDAAFATMVKVGAEAVIVQGTMAIGRTAELATERRIPAVSSGLIASGFAEVGGLMYYGPAAADYRRTAVYVDRILKGGNPAELAVEQPTKLELVINLKTAQTLGINIPKTLLFRADRVIE